MEEGGQAVV